jgi:hypothetical protein
MVLNLELLEYEAEHYPHNAMFSLNKKIKYKVCKSNVNFTVEM